MKWPMVSALFLAAPVFAATYDEALQGDLPYARLTGSTEVLELDFGINTVAGSVILMPDELGPGDLDSIIFVVPDKAWVDVYATTALGDGDGLVTASAWVWDIQNNIPDGGWLANEMVWADVPGTTRLHYPHFPGHREMLSAQGFLGAMKVEDWRVINYSITLTVAPASPPPIPEPATASMLLLGLAGLARAARRSRRAKA